MLLVLAMACAGLLIAAPIALLLSGGTDGGGSSEAPDGVFTGVPGSGADGDPARGGAGIATESAKVPAPGLPPVDAAGDAASVPAGPDGGGTAGGGGTPGGGSGAGGGHSGGTAAGMPGPAEGGTGSGGTPSGTSDPATDPGTDPAGDGEPAGGGGSTQPPAEEGEDCGCPASPLEAVTEVVDDLTGTTGEVAGGLLGE